ncbi:hypothetical protein HDU76_011610 [Blyttiomyces sp. JEL0837]|nr:hypothetical protein HDU76_011610 [Blyttiomyces sp. JEL0837]
MADQPNAVTAANVPPKPKKLAGPRIVWEKWMPKGKSMLNEPIKTKPMSLSTPAMNKTASRISIDTHNSIEPDQEAEKAKHIQPLVAHLIALSKTSGAPKVETQVSFPKFFSDHNAASDQASCKTLTFISTEASEFMNFERDPTIPTKLQNLIKDLQDHMDILLTPIPQETLEEIRLCCEYFSSENNTISLSDWQRSSQWFRMPPYGPELNAISDLGIKAYRERNQHKHIRPEVVAGHLKRELKKIQNGVVPDLALSRFRHKTSLLILRKSNPIRDKPKPKHKIAEPIRLPSSNRLNIFRKIMRSSPHRFYIITSISKLAFEILCHDYVSPENLAIVIPIHELDYQLGQVPDHVLFDRETRAKLLFELNLWNKIWGWIMAQGIIL